jgi:hypothetical protein
MQRLATIKQRLLHIGRVRFNDLARRVIHEVAFRLLNLFRARFRDGRVEWWRDRRIAVYDTFVSADGASLILIGHAGHLPLSLPLTCRFGSGQTTSGKDIEDLAHDHEGEQVRITIFPIPDEFRCFSEIEVMIFAGENDCIGQRRVRQRRNLQNRYLTVTTLMKDEGRFLLEWIEYYRLLGAEHFVIYDNRSLHRNRIRKSLKSLIDRKLVTLLDWDYSYKRHSADNSARFCQRGQMHHALYKYGEMSSWMLFIDVDEFIQPLSPAQSSLIPLLKSVEADGSIAGLQFKMIWFGNNGHSSPPPGLVIENYTRRSAEVISSGREKCAMKCKMTRVMFIHAPKSVDQNSRVITVSPEAFRINHYFATSAYRRNQNIDRFNEVEDTSMLRFVDKLGDALGQ